MTAMYVVKRDGTREPLDIDKLHRVVFWATEGLSGVSASEVEIKSQIQFYDGIKTTDIHETMIKAAADLITEDAPNYQYVAGRLVNYHLRKQVYGQYEPCPIVELVRRNVETGFYDATLLEQYSAEEWAQIDGFIDHERDMSLAYCAMEQMRGKYLVQDRFAGKVLETPQVLYILVAATLFASYPRETRLRWVRDYYDAISSHEISLPTPVMAGVRTAKKQASSCTLIECDDSLPSINATSSAIVDYVANRAGIGIGAGRIRALGSPIRNGDATHTGVTSFFKLFQASVNSCNQGGVRKGSATLHYPIWHYEIEDMLVLKNNKGTEENRVRHMDYSVQINKLFYERLITGGTITLFSPHDVPEVYEAFFADPERFKTLYEAAERKNSIRKKTIKAIDLFTALANERKDTGRIYIMNVDNCNTHSSFDESVAPVRMSNLCQEITLPTVPMGTVETTRLSIDDSALLSLMEEAETSGKTVRVVGRTPDSVEVEITEDKSLIALCTLSAVNWGVVKAPDDFQRICRLAVRGLDALLDYQDYPVEAARRHTESYRPLGVGIINLAYFLAKHNVRYSDGSALALVDEYAEAWSYYLIRASVDLAKERGACKLVANTKYAKGVVPHDTRKAKVDELVPHVERLDWDGLRRDLVKHGIRNATLMALMPAETSAQVANATNGIEPPRDLVSVKQSKHGVLKQVVPEVRRLKKRYELLWDQPSPTGYLQICAVLQKWIDQAISVNTSYNPKFFEDGKVPMSALLRDILNGYSWGIKTYYYNNTNDQAGEIDVDKLVGAQPKPTAPVEEDACDSCTI